MIKCKCVIELEDIFYDVMLYKFIKNEYYYYECSSYRKDEYNINSPYDALYNFYSLDGVFMISTMSDIFDKHFISLKEDRRRKIKMILCKD